MLTVNNYCPSPRIDKKNYKLSKARMFLQLDLAIEFHLQRVVVDSVPLMRLEKDMVVWMVSYTF